jgi:hypothetical protein
MDDPTSGQVTLPNEGQMTSPTESPQEKGAAMQSWLNTTQTPKPQTENTAPATAPQIPQQPLKTVGVPVTSLKRGGLLGVMDSMADVLAGKQRPELGKDADGNLYVKQHSLTRGEQWAKIAGEAFTGAAAGLAAGKGAGNQGKAAFAGMQAQQAQQQQQTAEMRQTMLDNANNQMLRMKMAEQAWRNTRLQTEADQHDIEFSQGQEDRLTKSGATLLGTVAHPGDLTGVLKVNPDLMKDLVNNHSLEFTPHFTDGKRDGFKVYKTPQGYRETLVAPGAEFPTFNSVTGAYDWHKTTDADTQGHIDDYWNAAGIAAQKFKGDKVEQDLKAAQTEETKAKTGAVPSEIAQHQAEAAAARARAAETPSAIGKNWAEAHAAEAKATDDAISSGQGPQGQALVDMIGTGQAPIGRLAYLLARKPELFAAVAAKYPNFDGGKIDSYVKAYQEFTSGDVSRDLVSGSTALQHMAELRALNTNASHEPWSPAYTAYMTKANQVAVELAAFYGNSTIPGIESYMKNLSSQLPGKRDKAITTQAESMGDRLDNYVQKWKNAAPSDAYEAKMPGISPEARAAWQNLDPKFKDRTAAPIFARQTPPAPAVKIIPGERTITMQDGSLGVVRNGQWVKAQQ